MDEELVGEMGLGLGILGDDQQAVRVLVDAVHQHAHPLVLGIGSLRQSQVESEGIHQRPRVVSVARMDHHAGGFVDHQDVVILISDVQRNVFRKNLHPAPLIRHHELDDVAGADDSIGLGRLVIDQDITQLDSLLDAVAGGVLLMGGDEFIYAKRRLALVGNQAEMLEHFLLVLLREKGLFVEGRHYSVGSFPGSRVRYRLMAVP